MIEGESHSFQVDLRGLVDLFSHHLYSSPRVFVRELLQNAVDALTQRLAQDPGAPARIAIYVEDGGLRIEDTGIGLTEADVHEFLATIGRSSKREPLETASALDALAAARVGFASAGADGERAWAGTPSSHQFIGQFGVGLLAGFVVADQIEVLTRSAVVPGAPLVRWLASADGSYTVRTLDPTDPGGAVAARTEPGTTVRLVPRRGAEEWFTFDRIVELARHYGSLLPYDITVSNQAVTGTPTGTPAGTPAGTPTVRVSETPPPWRRQYASPRDRSAALSAYAQQHLGFIPLDIIDLEVPLAGVHGVAFILPTPVSPAQGGRHRVYLKGMLLSDAADGLLPEWAFFARCVVETDTLRPTASREALYEDETLSAVREALGQRVREWLTGLAATEPERLARFLSVHFLGVKALARHDDELYQIMLPWLTFETTDGRISLVEFTRRHRIVYLAPTVEEFRQVAAIASAQGLGVVNGGYTYDTELVQRLPVAFPGTVVESLVADVVLAHLDLVDPDQELPLAGFLALARARLDRLDCDVVLRTFHPVNVPALYLDSRAAQQERIRAEVEAEADELWSDILSRLRSTARAQLVLNYASPLLRRVAALPNQDLAGTAVEALYGQALLMTHRPLRSAETALLNRAFGDLLTWASSYAKEEQ